ncbi:storkhead-box protein 2-like [Stegodyphus dumicola]|uniref:storkhead-box protein 2-like n=1 Tax=Stegodyphus dumicola TaxID=202533 RepID=UPI0015AAAF37|nr:storkhead-box protein 2-like [Stegodyphus dumicola]
MIPVAQTQFAPLSEALCKVVADLNGEQIPATTSSIKAKLEENFPEMQVPSEDILYKTLGGLIKERKLYHTGSGYFVVSQDTYRQRSVSPLCERQMLMTNEEAIVRLHGHRKDCSMAIQVDEMDIAAAWKCSTSSFLHATTQQKEASCQSSQVASPELQMMERSNSLKILRVKGRSKTNERMDRGGSFKETSTANKLGYLATELESDMNEIHKSEKQSMLAKILKRMHSLTDKSSKHVAFSAQFPPLEWLDDDKLHCHSVATQTQLLVQQVCPKPSVKGLETAGPRIPWEDVENFERKTIPHYMSSNYNYKKIQNDSDGQNSRKNTTVYMRQGNSRYSPSHRYSHGTLTNYSKRRHRHRRSSSESPKVQKPIANGYQSHSTSSKSTMDHSEDKVSHSSSSGSVLPPNRKAIVNPRTKVPEQSRNETLVSESIASAQKEKKVGEIPPSTPKSRLKDSFSCSPKPKKTSLNISNPITPVSKKIEDKKNGSICNNLDNKDSENNKIFSNNISDAKLAMSESSSETSASCNGSAATKLESGIRPLALKSLIEMPKPPSLKETKSLPAKEIVIDNSVSVEVAVEKSPPSISPKGNNHSTTIVTEETTVTKGSGNSKVVTVTSITTSLSHGGLKDLNSKHSPDLLDEEISSEKQKPSVNDLNIETLNGSHIIDCSSSCNIVTEVK